MRQQFKVFLFTLVLLDTAQAAPQASKTCPKGFTAAPDIQTCIRISGRVRAELGLHSGSSTSSKTDFYPNGRLNLDARTQTDQGLLRTVIRVQGRP